MAATCRFCSIAVRDGEREMAPGAIEIEAEGVNASDNPAMEDRP